MTDSVVLKSRITSSSAGITIAYEKWYRAVVGVIPEGKVAVAGKGTVVRIGGKSVDVGELVRASVPSSVGAIVTVGPRVLGDRL